MLVYVNWVTKKIISEKEFMQELNKDYELNLFNEEFDEYLYNHYTCIELFNLTDKKRKEIEQQFKEDLFVDCIDDGCLGFEPYEV